MSLRPAAAVAKPLLADNRLKAVLSVGMQRNEQMDDHQTAVEKAAKEAEEKYTGKEWIVVKSVEMETAMINGGKGVAVKVMFRDPSPWHYLEIHVGGDKTIAKARFMFSIVPFDIAAEEIFDEEKPTTAGIEEGKQMVKGGELLKQVKLYQSNKRWETVQGGNKMSYRISETAATMIAAKGVPKIVQKMDEYMLKHGDPASFRFLELVPGASEQLAKGVMNLALAELKGEYDL